MGINLVIAYPTIAKTGTKVIFIKYNRNASNALRKRFPKFYGSSASYNAELMERIRHSLGAMDKASILEVGGIDRPLLEKNKDYNYVGLDIESKEQCYEVYDEFMVQSIENPLEGRYELIISKTLLEHVPDNKASIKTMYDALREGGETIHYIPSKYHPYSIALRLIGPKLQKKLIPLLRPAAAEVTGYPAFFSHCSPGQMKRLFKGAGFVDIDVQPYYRVNDYFAFFIPLFILDSAFENFCRTFNLRFLASGFVISAKRPPDTGLSQ